MYGVYSVKIYFISLCIIAVGSCALFGCGIGEVETDIANSEEMAVIDEDVIDINLLFDEQPDKVLVNYDNNENNNNLSANVGTETNVESDSAVYNNTETYILNKNTKKFHYQSCSSVKDIKDKNRESEADRNRILSEGYVPCKICNP